MDRDWTPVVVPLGPRLRHMAARISRARLASSGWLAASDAVRTRVAALLTPSPSRYDRVEVSERMLFGPGDAADDDPGIEPVETGGPEPLPAAVRDRLRSHVGGAADVMRIHHDERAHHIAAEHRADAVASGSDVYFRHGRYQPHDADGFALLAHEATHVSRSLRPNANWQRPMQSDVAAEEAAATTTERRLRHSSPAPLDRTIGPAPAAPRPVDRGGPVPPAQAPAPRPMTAALDRPVDPPAAAPLDMERLRQMLSRDLLRQIRAELERGG